MEVVCGACVVIVVDDGGEEKGEDLQVRHPVLQSSLGDAAVSRLENIAGVQVVMVGGPVAEIKSHYRTLKEIKPFVETKVAMKLLTKRIQPQDAPAKSPGLREESSIY